MIRVVVQPMERRIVAITLLAAFATIGCDSGPREGMFPPIGGRAATPPGVPKEVKVRGKTIRIGNPNAGSDTP